jgi:hypothetical protein
MSPTPLSPEDEQQAKFPIEAVNSGVGGNYSTRKRCFTHLIHAVNGLRMSMNSPCSVGADVRRLKSPGKWPRDFEV